MKTKKKTVCILLAAACLAGSFTLAPEQAQASTKIQIIDEQLQAASNMQVVDVTDTTKKIGEVTFSSKYSQADDKWNVYYKKGGDKKLLTTKSGISTRIMTDGKIVYYSIGDYSNKNNCTDTYYEKNLSTGKTKKLFSVKCEDSSRFGGYYKEKIYYIKDLDPGTLCYYNLKTGKKKSLLKNVSDASQYDNVLLCMSYEGNNGSVEFQSFNAKTNKAKLLTKALVRYDVIEKQIYYVESTKKYAYDDNICNVVRCDMDGSNKKVLLKNKRIKGYINEITSSCITYQNYDTGKAYTLNY